jgi:phospholipid/cholesterol/gamma-HCH transport system substrate-binding protein
MARQQVARIVGGIALVIAVVAIVIVLFTGGSSYVLHAQFSDAGQLVNGDLVTVAGHSVGSVGKITLTNNGLADVELDISDSSITPIRQGTIASVGQLSLTGVANRFVGLSLGTGAAIADGGTLPVRQTRGIVDLDVLLDALTPKVRTSLQRIIKTGAYFVGQPTPKQINRSILYFNPALSQSAQLGAQIVADKAALNQVISASAKVSTALASRNQDLGGLVTNTATWLREVASQRSALQDELSRAPAVLHQGTAVLADTNFTLKAINPALRDLQPVAPRLGSLLRVVVPTARNAIPTIAGVQSLVPSAKRALTALPAVVRSAIPAVQSLTRALKPITPILAGLRPYTPDVVAGFFTGVGGGDGGNYDANGGYLKTMLSVQAGGGTLTGVVNVLGTLLGTLTGAVTPVGNGNTNIAPCPGGGGPPAPDNTNPWTGPDLLPTTGTLCLPQDNQK